jgi:hypothetical protein
MVPKLAQVLLYAERYISPSPFLTTLHLWLIGQGVDVRFIDDPRPTEHNLIERTHQTLYQQAVAEQTFTDGDSLDVRLTERPARLWL